MDSLGIYVNKVFISEEKNRVWFRNLKFFFFLFDVATCYDGAKWVVLFRPKCYGVCRYLSFCDMVRFI